MADLFEEKARDWDQRPGPARISQGVGAALLQHVALSPATRVMDFGAGTGLICSQVAPYVAKIYAVDVSAAMLDKLAAKPELRGKVETVCQDIMATPLGKPVDLIISAMALHHVRDTDLLLRTFAQHLAPGGVIALADLDSEDGSFHPADVQGVFHHGFDRDALRAALERSGFGDIELVTALRLEKEGRSYPIFLVTATRR